MMDALLFFQRWFPYEINHLDGYLQFMDSKSPRTGRMLDLGCGNNELIARFRTSEREVWGADFVTHPHLRHPEWFRPLREDGVIPFGDGTFDVVCSHMVMEHVATPRVFLEEIARVLKPGGWYIGESIHSRHYVTWIRTLLDVLPHSWVQSLVRHLYGRAEHDTFPTCYRMNSRTALTRFAQEAKLELAHWRGYVSPGYFLFSPFLCRGTVIFDWCVETVMPGFGQLYFTVALRKPAESRESRSESQEPANARHLISLALDS